MSLIARGALTDSCLSAQCFRLSFGISPRPVCVLFSEPTPIGATMPYPEGDLAGIRMRDRVYERLAHLQGGRLECLHIRVAVIIVLVKVA